MDNQPTSEVTKQKRGRRHRKVHNLNAISPHRVRRTRTALCLGKTKEQVAKNIFKVSYQTLKLYMRKDDPRSRTLKRAVEEGEALRDQPLGELICYLLDKRENILGQLLADQEAALQASREKHKELEIYSQRLEQALSDNLMLRGYRKEAQNALMVVNSNRHLGLIQETVLKSESKISSIQQRKMSKPNTGQDQPTSDDAINILEEIKGLVLLDAEEHGTHMAEHSQDLMQHIEKVLIDARQAKSEGE